MITKLVNVSVKNSLRDFIKECNGLLDEHGNSAIKTGLLIYFDKNSLAQYFIGGKGDPDIYEIVGALEHVKMSLIDENTPQKGENNEFK